jgi:hypothetical protein
MAIDSSGNIYFAEANGNRIRKVTASTGVITTIAGTGSPGCSGEGGLAIYATVSGPNGLALDASGNIYFSDFCHKVRKISAVTGVITTVAGTGYAGPSGGGGYNGDNQLATNAELANPEGIALDGNGNLYIVDSWNQRIREVSAATGIITTVAGNGTYGYNGDNQLATSAELNYPCGIALDGFGNIYIADLANYRIREVTVSTGLITTVAGTGVEGYSGDGGLATFAELNYNVDVAVDAIGNLYIADNANNRVRKVTNGTITTFAGNGVAGHAGDGGLATNAELNWPTAVATDSGGNVYVAEQYNNDIRVVGGLLTPTVFNPLYKVFSILYSPPGNQSTQGYGTTTTNGTTTTVGNSFTFSNQINFSTGVPSIFSAGATYGTS